MHPIGAEENKLEYLTQLDGLRAGAVSIVIFQHSTTNVLTEGVGLNGVGVYGVWLFFVLSGFLITRGLLVMRDGIDARAHSTASAFKVFYARRALRIFPPYYLLLAVLMLVGIPHALRGEALWHLGYLSNWLFLKQANWTPNVGHFWSLAVEEQFYLVWPAIILLVPRRYIGPLVGMAILVGPVARGGIAAAGGNYLTVLVPTPNALDCLGLGAALAWHRWSRPGRVAERALMLRWAGILGGLGLAMVVVLSFGYNRGFRLFALIEATSAGLFSVWLIGRSVNEFGGVGGALLSSRPLQSIGRVSYGIYLFHAFVILSLENARRAFEISAPSTIPGQLISFAMVAVASYAVASMSYVLFERPLIGLKRYILLRPAKSA